MTATKAGQSGGYSKLSQRFILCVSDALGTTTCTLVPIALRSPLSNRHCRMDSHDSRTGQSQPVPIRSRGGSPLPVNPQAEAAAERESDLPPESHGLQEPDLTRAKVPHALRGSPATRFAQRTERPDKSTRRFPQGTTCTALGRGGEKPIS